MYLEGLRGVGVGWVERVEGRGSGKYAFYGRNNTGSMSPEIYRLGDIVSTNFFHVISRPDRRQKTDKQMDRLIMATDTLFFI